MKMIPLERFRKKVKKTNTEDLLNKLKNYARDSQRDRYSKVIKEELKKRDKDLI